MPQFKRLSMADASPRIRRGDFVLVDIRDGQSFAAGHIPGARLLNQSNAPAFMENTRKDAAILVCCYHGNSSQSAAQFLVDTGFQEVYSLDGGFELWKLHHPDQIEREPS